jgi:hypothetical protein
MQILLTWGELAQEIMVPGKARKGFDAAYANLIKH